MAQTPNQPTQSLQPRETPSSCAETRAAILDAAEQLFANKGVSATSVRDITGLANVNLASINYHFGSKDRLAVEVFIRALEPANQRRLAWLDRLEAEADGKPLEVEKIMEVLIRPMLEDDAKEVRNSDAFRQLMSRCFHELNPEVKALVKARFAETCQRFDAALSRACPDLPADELFWRTHFVFGAMHHALGAWIQFDFLPLPSLSNGEKPRRLDVEELVQQLILCGTAAFRARLPKKVPQPLPAILKNSETDATTATRTKSSHAIQ